MPSLTCPCSDVEGDGKTDREDGQDGDHSVFLIKDPFIDWEFWIFVNLLETVSIKRSWSLFSSGNSLYPSFEYDNK